MSTKNSIKDLAIFGGKPMFSQPLHVGRPNIGSKDEFLSLTNEIIDNKWLTNAGPKVKELESKLADYLGVKNVILMCNATIALEIAIRAMDLKGEVIMPSFTFIACAHALQWQEITPVFCDIDPLTHNIDPNLIEQHITPRTTGILGVHLWGRPAKVEQLTDIAEKHKLKLFFDASHGFACTYKTKRLANFGLAEIFSFHATKFFNTLEGGAVVTNDDELAGKIRLMKNFGFAGYDNVVYIGTNGKMNEVSAAMGIANLNHIDKVIEKNKANYSIYRKELSAIPGLSMILYNEHESNNYQYIVFEVDENTTGISRDKLISILHKENILARKYFYPGIHNMQPYKSLYPYAKQMLSNTELIATKVISFPTGTAISDEEIYSICKIVRYAIENSYNINKELNVMAQI